MQIVIVTGMSGSGKSSAMDVLEDIGYYCIDNLPPQLLGKFIDICRQTENKIEKLAISVDLRSGKLFGDAYHVLRTLERTPELDVKVLYLEATDEVIIKRYKETRRKHPLDERFNGSLHSAIAYEREQLLPVKGIADYYIESSYISAAQLKKQIKELSEERKKVRKLSKQEMDKHAQFNRAAKPYVDAKKLLTQQENFKHFDEIAALYDTAKANVEANEKAEAEEEAKRLEEEKAELARRKAEKAAKKRK